jgi:pimeloyl-ACP methyl ester carboxylesterase
VNRGAHFKPLLIALAFGSTFYSSALPASSYSSPAADGCAYPTTDYATPEGEKYHMREFPGGGFFYHFSSNKTRLSPGDTSRLVVLVAGAPEPHYFDALRALLLEAKYRVLVLDLPGKEHLPLSSRPTPEYIVERFEKLWFERADEHKFYDEKDFLIVGTSISGPVTAVMAARLARQGPRLALVSVVGMPREWPPEGVTRILRVPLLSDLLAPFIVPRLVESRWKHGELLCPQHFPELFRRQEMELRGGFARINYLELAKSLALSDQTAAYQQLARTHVPVLLAFGDRDPFCDQVEKLLAVVPKPQSVAVTIESSAHITFVEQPAALFGTLDSFSKADAIAELVGASTRSCVPH